MGNIPQEMRALQIDRYYEDLSEAIRHLQVVKKPVLKPPHGHVLVRIEATPCNPSDLLLLQGRYGKVKALPTVPGWEGAGTVVATGGGFLGRWLLGKKVACAIQNDSDGTWAEYCVVSAKNCIPLKSDIDLDQGSTLIINPLTALGMVETAKKGGHMALIQTAAASQVGRMVLKLALDRGIPSIHIVRRKDQEELLRQMGAEIVLNSETVNFRKELKEHAARLKATIAFDAVGGALTGMVFSAMPDNSKVLVYGALSGAFCSDISPLGLIFQCKSVEGFWLTKWLGSKGMWGIMQASNHVQKLMGSGTFHTAISERVPLEGAVQALDKYQKEMTLGKVIIRP